MNDKKYPDLPEPAMPESKGFCCGNFSTGAEYMGQTEEVCCGNPDEAWPGHYSAEQMEAYADATCAMRAAQPNPAGHISTEAYDRLQALVDSQAARILAFDDAPTTQAPQPVEPAVSQVGDKAVLEDIEHLAVNRYRPVPAGVLAYKVVGGDGARSLFSGTKDECQIVARKLTEAFLDGAYAALVQPQEAAPSQDAEAVGSRALLERILSAMEGVIDVADRKTDEFEALRSCVIDLTVMLFGARAQEGK